MICLVQPTIQLSPPGQITEKLKQMTIHKYFFRCIGIMVLKLIGEENTAYDKKYTQQIGDKISFARVPRPLLKVPPFEHSNKGANLNTYILVVQTITITPCAANYSWCVVHIHND